MRSNQRSILSLVVGLVLTVSASAQTETATAQTQTDQAVNPFSFSMEYSLWSDYVWRGINLSEPLGREGRERPHHQL